jgi:hypothetical protein
MKIQQLVISAVLALCTACGGSDSGAQKDAGVTIDAAKPGTPDAACFTNPTTYHEIINACTDAQKIYKNTHPPFELPDGGLPPLPN